MSETKQGIICNKRRAMDISQLKDWRDIFFHASGQVILNSIAWNWNESVYIEGRQEGLMVADIVMIADYADKIFIINKASRRSLKDKPGIEWI